MDTLELIAIGLLFVAATMGLTFGSYFLARHLLAPRSEEGVRDLAASVVFRVAALHGLILALVFAQELGNLNSLRDAVEREANLLRNVYFDLDRYDAERTAEIRASIAGYVRHVLDDEWDRLDDEKRLSPEAWQFREKIYLRLLDLHAETSRQAWLRTRMLEKIAAVGGDRKTRETAAATDISTVFWIVAFVGVVVVAAPYFSFPPNPANLALLALFSIYTGIVLFFIYIFDNPFNELGALDPIAFEILYDEILHPPHGTPGVAGGS